MFGDHWDHSRLQGQNIWSLSMTTAADGVKYILWNLRKRCFFYLEAIKHEQINKPEQKQNFYCAITGVNIAISSLTNWSEMEYVEVQERQIFHSNDRFSNNALNDCTSFEVFYKVSSNVSHPGVFVLNKHKKNDKSES